MTADLSKVDVTNAALQKDVKAAKSVKNAHQAVVDFLHVQYDVVTPPDPIPVPPNPNPSYPYVPVPPVVTSLPVSVAQWFRDVTKPQEITNIHVKGAPDYGIGVMGWGAGGPSNVGSPFNIHDIIGENIGHTPPTMNGTGEAGVWIGVTANVKRFIANGTWMGLWTGSFCTSSLFQDFKATSQGVGVYVEHNTVGCTFTKFDIKSEGTGINCEWWYGGSGSHDNTFDTGSIYCPAGGYGVFVDAGNYGYSFKNIVFYGPGNALGFPNNLVDKSKPNTYQNCAFLNSGQKITYHNNAIG